jgi:acetylglutamate kinase
VVKVGGAVLRDDLDALTSSLAFLQDVGLTPIVIHGAGPQLDNGAGSGRHRQKQTIDGLRVTSSQALGDRASRVACAEPEAGRGPAGKAVRAATSIVRWRVRVRLRGS